MKKLFKYIAAAVLAVSVLCGCGGNDPGKTADPTPEQGSPFKDITLSIEEGDYVYFVNEEGKIVISASENLPENLSISIESDNPSLLVPTSNPVTMTANTNKVEAKFNCLGEGKASLKITAVSEIKGYGNQEFLFTIKPKNIIPPEPEPEYTEILRPIYANRSAGPSCDLANFYYIDEFDEYKWMFCGTFEYSDRNGSGYKGKGDPLSTHIIFYKTLLKGDLLKFGGNFVGEVINGMPFYTHVPEGTEINADLDWVGAINGGNYFEMAKVTDENNTNQIVDGDYYFVMLLPVGGDPQNFGLSMPAPAWLKIRVEGQEITLLDGRIKLLETDSFRVGQTEADPKEE